MSSKGKEFFIHPYTFFLVNEGLTKVLEFLGVPGSTNRNDAAEQLLWFTTGLESGIQLKLAPKIEKLKQFLSHRWTEEDQAFYDIMSAIHNELHDAHYYESAKFARPRIEEEAKLQVPTLGVKKP